MARRLTKEYCIKIAKNYSSKGELKKADNSVYQKIRVLGIQDEAYKHISSSLKLDWTKEEAFAIAKKYSKLSDFRKNENPCICFLRKNGLYEEATKHMTRVIGNTYTIDEIMGEALKYEFRSHFSKSASNIYRYAEKIGVLDEVCGHMKGQGDYVWDRESIRESALKYSSFSDWRKLDRRAYRACEYRGLMDDKYITGHLKKIKKLHYTLQQIIDDAKKYSNKGEWNKNSKSIYMFAWRNGFDKDPRVIGHMEKKFVWTEELLRKRVLMCEKISDFPHRAVQVAKKIGIWDELRGMMRCGLTKISIDDIKKSSAKYKTKAQWWEFDRSAYCAAMRRGLLDDVSVTGHMVSGLINRRGDGDRLRYEDIFAEEFVYPIYGRENVIRDKFSLKDCNLNFRPDFLIKDKMIVIEFDERRHIHSNHYKSSDPIRQKMIEEAGYAVIRFSEEELIEYLQYSNKEYLLQ
jgi:very-short-patch-repair endonuclease